MLFSPVISLLNSLPRVHLRNVLESQHYQHGKIKRGEIFELHLHNKQPANLGRLCFWLPDFRYLQPDLHEYYAPRTPTEIKKTTQCLCKNRLLASKKRGTQTQRIFPKSGSAPLIWVGHWVKWGVQPPQCLAESNPISTSTKIQQNSSYNFGIFLCSLLFFNHLDLRHFF